MTLNFLGCDYGPLDVCKHLDYLGRMIAAEDDMGHNGDGDIGTWQAAVWEQITYMRDMLWEHGSLPFGGHPAWMVYRLAEWWAEDACCLHNADSVYCILSEFVASILETAYDAWSPTVLRTHVVSRICHDAACGAFHSESCPDVRLHELVELVIEREVRDVEMYPIPPFCILALKEVKVKVKPEAEAEDLTTARQEIKRLLDIAPTFPQHSDGRVLAVSDALTYTVANLHFFVQHTQFLGTVLTKLAEFWDIRARIAALEGCSSLEDLLRDSLLQIVGTHTPALRRWVISQATIVTRIQVANGARKLATIALVESVRAATEHMMMTQGSDDGEEPMMRTIGINDSLVPGALPYAEFCYAIYELRSGPKLRRDTVVYDVSVDDIAEHFGLTSTDTNVTHEVVVVPAEPVKRFFGGGRPDIIHSEAIVAGLLPEWCLGGYDSEEEEEEDFIFVEDGEADDSRGDRLEEAWKDFANGTIG